MSYNSCMREDPKNPALSETAIVNGILAAGKYETSFMGDDVITLQYGSKEVIIVIDGNKRTVQTRVETRLPKERRPNETTLLYTVAKAVMGKYANKYGKNLTYTASSSSENMNNWIHGKGAGIFDFKPVADIQDEFTYHYQTTIFATNRTDSDDKE